MRERPILFSAPMVRAIVAGTKTQTRRVVRLPEGAEPPITVRNPYGVPPDRLWVRETWAIPPGSDDPREVAYRADRGEAIGPWKPSIHMPRRFSRLLLEVTGTRIERLQDISEADARDEGVGELAGSYRTTFEHLWDRINGDRAPWRSNPWVWVISFKRIEAAA